VLRFVLVKIVHVLSVCVLGVWRVTFRYDVLSVAFFGVKEVMKFISFFLVTRGYISTYTSVLDFFIELTSSSGIL